MRIVIDTNVLLVSASRKSGSYWLFNAFLNKKFELAFTTDIITEYDEQFAIHWNAAAAETIVPLVVNSTNSIPTIVYYHLNLIYPDVDDNKFSDCAFASNADYLVTNDSDFNILKKIDFPKFGLLLYPSSNKYLPTETCYNHEKPPSFPHS